MGMAASQVRLLQLTERNNYIGNRLMSLSLQKNSLSRDMKHVTDEYHTAISAKKLQWSTGNANYVDMSYSMLMTPGASNGNSPYMITDTAGRIVVDRNYKKYAEMISADGTPGDWDECKYEVLSGILGVSEDDLRNYDGYYLAFMDNKQALLDIEELEPINRSSFTVQDTNSVSKLLRKMPRTNGISDWASAYGNSNKKISKNELAAVLEKIKESLSKYFLEDAGKFEAACDSVAEWSSDDDVTVKDLIDRLMGNYKGQGGTYASQEYADANGETYPVWYDVDSTAYANYKRQHDQWRTLREEAQNAMESSLSAYNQLFPAEIESKIAFYDDLLSTIAEKGWVCNEEVNDPQYLNQMLQNNQYYITTVDRNLVHGSNCEYSYQNLYDTDIAMNCQKIAQVSDSDVRDEALVKYERDKRIINSKESAIDTRMKNLETEQAAIKQMMQSIQNVMNNNIEQHMNIFS